MICVICLPQNLFYLPRSLTWYNLPAGLCGNFNSNQADDFLKLSGVTEATAAGFANSWKTHASCPNVKNHFENPCRLSMETGRRGSFRFCIITLDCSQWPMIVYLSLTERYARHWCSMLSDPQGVFASCHSEISPDSYKEVSLIFAFCWIWISLQTSHLQYFVSLQNCMYDSCNCRKSEDCLCAAVSSYAHACASAGIQIIGWRNTICGEFCCVVNEFNLVNLNTLASNHRSNTLQVLTWPVWLSRVKMIVYWLKLLMYFYR